AELERIVSDIRGRQDHSKPALDIFGAAEGQELDLCGTYRTNQQAHESGSAITAPAVVTGSILMAVSDPEAAGKRREPAQTDGNPVLELKSAKEALVGADAFQPSLVILECEAGDADLVEQYVNGMRHRPTDVPLLVVADQQDAVPRSEAI